jgi:hypothetical protein
MGDFLMDFPWFSTWIFSDFRGFCEQISLVFLMVDGSKLGHWEERCKRACIFLSGMHAKFRLK